VEVVWAWIIEAAGEMPWMAEMEASITGNDHMMVLVARLMIAKGPDEEDEIEEKTGGVLGMHDDEKVG
jgi:hypothetical protein